MDYSDLENSEAVSEKATKREKGMRTKDDLRVRKS